MVRSPFSGYGPGNQRMISMILRGIAELGDDQIIDALRKTPRAVRAILYFCYGKHELALPTEHIDPIDPARAFTRDEGVLGDDDLLHAESHKLVRLFVRGVHATLTDKRRLELWTDILERLPQAERALMETIRRDRVIPGIPRAVVDVAFPGMLEERPMAYDVPVQATPAPAPAPAPVLAPREMTEAERRYAEVYSKMKNGNANRGPSP
jgi:hypothetical protein